MKDRSVHPVGPTLTVVQEQWDGERTPYRIGQELIVVLVSTPDGFARLAGPHYTFLVNGTQVISVNPRVSTEGQTTAEFLARLRSLAR